MTNGFVLIVTLPGKERDVYRQLMEVPEIKDLHLLFGEYDLIAKVQVEGYNAISNVVVNSIRSVDGVEDTITMMEVPFYPPPPACPGLCGPAPRDGPTAGFRGRRRCGPSG